VTCLVKMSKDEVRGLTLGEMRLETHWGKMKLDTKWVGLLLGFLKVSRWVNCLGTDLVLLLATPWG